MRILFIHFLLFSCMALHAQEIIYWDADATLSWNDFKGPAEHGNPFDAETRWAVKYEVELRGDTLFFHIPCFMETHKSWVKKEKKSPALLIHEQGHFNIAEIYTRTLRKTLAEHRFTTENMQKDIPEIYNKIMSECTAFQRRYDQATNHSKDQEEQVIWDVRISGMLSAHQNFASPDIKVALQKK